MVHEPKTLQIELNQSLTVEYSKMHYKALTKNYRVHQEDTNLIH